MSAMNLGDSHLRHVNTSRPQLVHSTSKQSVTASDDYYSLTSDHSSNEDRAPAPRYETPPMHSRQEAHPPEKPLSTIKSVKEEDAYPDEKSKVPDGEGHTIKRKPVSSSSDGTVIRRPTSTVSSTTPGVDDTPYIHFAIDQLTRDEEVAGSRHQSDVPGSAFVDPEKTKTTPAHEIRMPPPPPIPASEDPRLSPTDNVLVPTDPPAVTYKYPKLRFVPTSLKPISLGSLMACCLLMMAGHAFCGAYTLHHDGLYDYDGTGTRRYFLFQYLPQILASAVILWLLIINSTLNRIYPFVALASGRGSGNSGVLYDSRLFTTNLLIPNISAITRGGPWLAVWAITFWLAMFTVPLQSCLFQTRYYPNAGLWRWTTSQIVTWILFVMYFLIILGLSALLLRFTVVETGLKWDPRSLADILAIFHRSNILNDFERSEIETVVSRPPKDLKLGYWRQSRHGAEPFYCIGDENAPLRRYSLEKGRMRPVNDQPPLDIEAQRPAKHVYDTFRSDIHNPNLRYRWIPWFLRDTFVVAWTVIAVVLLLAFLVVSYVNQAAENGFLPQLPSPTSSIGFSSADFLYSFVPSFLGMVLFLVWQPLDAYFRALQPFANLARPYGSSAEKSLLLDYPACLPLQVTLRALLAGHFRVAWISFVALWSVALPILAGGVFTAQWNRSDQQVRTAASMPGFIALTVLLAIYAFSFLTIFPTRKRYLPHDISTLGELVSFFYQSPLLAEAAFKEPQSKIDLVTKLLGSPLEERMSSHFAFGIYMGQDGKEHLGIDRYERPGYGEMLVKFA